MKDFGFVFKQQIIKSLVQVLQASLCLGGQNQIQFKKKFSVGICDGFNSGVFIHVYRCTVFCLVRSLTLPVNGPFRF